MASGIFAVLDDIAALMDDVAVASKIATQKTAGILGDDLAVNAEKATGFLASREIPVLWAITKGSFVNKLIIVPVVLTLNVFLPIATKIALIIGGFYLAYEAVEKIAHYFFTKNKQEKTIIETTEDGPEVEKVKIRSAIITDFILSVEIIIIALSTVLNASILVQVLTVSVVAVLATVGVYGIVALIVRMDDFGYKLIKKSNQKGFLNAFGSFLVKALPNVIKSLSFIGVLALILVSGGIFAHQIDYFHYILPNLPSIFKEVGFGLLAGILTFLFVQGAKKVLQLFKTN